jgi:hypothetical protein
MQYSEFIKTLQKHNTNILQAVYVPYSCAPIQIPQIFLDTLPNIVAILNANVEKICTQPNQRIVIFSIQPVSVAVKSNLPKKLNRITNAKYPNNHLCCSLGYVLLNNNEELSNIPTHKQQNFFIDFTIGLIADINYYLNLFYPIKQLPENIYGTIHQVLLKKVWSTFVEQQYGDNNNVKNSKKKTSHIGC